MELRDQKQETSLAKGSLDSNPLLNEWLDASKPGTPNPTYKVVDEFCNSALKLFDRFDQDHDGWIFQDEIARAAQDPSVRGKDAQVLATMINKSAELGLLPKADNGTHLRRSSIVDCQNSNREVSENLDFYEAVGELQLAESLKDADNNGAFSKPEIELALNASKKEAWSGKVAGKLEKLFSEFGKAKNSEIPTDELLNISLKHIRETEIESAMAMAAEKEQILNSQGALNLYSERNKLDSIRPEAVRQGEIGDCYFEAAIASIAATNPRFLERMIKYNGNGTYSVFFPGQPQIVVRPPTQTESTLYSKPTVHGTWPSILEEAYGIYKQRSGQFGVTPQHALGDGGNPGQVFEAMTGKQPETFLFFDRSLLHKRPGPSVTLTQNQAEIGARLRDAIKESKPMTCGNTYRKNGFITQHSCSIIGFDPKGIDGGTLTVRNPWGNPSMPQGDTFKMSFKEFWKNFDQVQIGASCKVE